MDLRIRMAVRTFEQLQQTVRAGQTIIVTEAEGRETRGRIDRLTPSSLVLKTDMDNVDKPRTFAPAAIVRIRRTDRVWNGVGIGAAAGIVSLLVVTRAVCGDYGECTANFGAGMSLPLVGGGIAVGGLIDRFIGNDVLYLSRGADTPPSVGLTVRF